MCKTLFVALLVLAAGCRSNREHAQSSRATPFRFPSTEARLSGASWMIEPPSHCPT